MKLIFEENIREKTAFSIAEKMLAAARTAPKGRGKDTLSLAIAGKSTIQTIAELMMHMFKSGEASSNFARDAENLLASEALVLIGTRIEALGLSVCGLCGFKNCAEKSSYSSVPCAFNTGDLGIALGSAVSIAADFRIDNRIMYTAGLAAVRLKILGDDIKIAYGIPLSISSKNPFFDRKPV
jgi:uncharacterized ferredoxin-like protein